MAGTSIAVDEGYSGDILITNDLRFSGTDNCRHCRFNPCKVKRWYGGYIEDCSLWNKTDPDTLGPIRDDRNRHKHRL